MQASPGATITATLGRITWMRLLAERQRYEPVRADFAPGRAALDAAFSVTIPIRYRQQLPDPWIRSRLLALRRCHARCEVVPTQRALSLAPSASYCWQMNALSPRLVVEAQPRSLSASCYRASRTFWAAAMYRRDNRDEANVLFAETDLFPSSRRLRQGDGRRPRRSTAAYSAFGVVLCFAGVPC